MLEVNQIYHMDCLEGMKLIEDNSIDLVVTDPPYKTISGGDSDCRYTRDKLIKKGNIFKENNIKFSNWLVEIYRILKEGTHAYIMCNDRNMQELLNSLGKLKLVNILVWKKNNCTPNKFYMKNLEFIVMVRKGKERWINNMGTKQLIEVNNVRNKLHPTEKPIELMKILIENSSNEGDLILDPFMGSGSVALSCIETNRNFIGFELDENYYNIAQKRIENL